MTQKERIHQEIERTLQSLDGIQRAEANPFLFTRIKARMNKQRSSGWERTFSFISRPVVALAVLVIVMAVNGWSLYDKSSVVQTEVGEFASNGNGLPEFESEYRNITSTDNYEYENTNNQ